MYLERGISRLISPTHSLSHAHAHTHVCTPRHVDTHVFTHMLVGVDNEPITLFLVFFKIYIILFVVVS